MTVTWKEALTDKQLARKNELKQLRAKQRKQQKQRLKRAMGCVYNDCAEKRCVIYTGGQSTSASKIF